MKNCIWFIFILLVACANENKLLNADSDMILENAEMYDQELQQKEISLEQLTSRKLQNYFELIQLQKKHPEFKDDITEQLDSFTFNPASIDDGFNYSVENIRQVGIPITVSDSVVKLKLAFDKVGLNNTLSDSVNAIITTKTILIDRIERSANEIVFTRIK